MRIEPQLLLLLIPILAVIGLNFLISYLRSRKATKETIASYTLREAVLTKAEAKFMVALKPVVGEKYLVFAKIRLADIIQTKSGEGYYAAFNKLSAKHLDFLLCEPITYAPVLGIELDDSSHKKSDRKQRDEFVDDVFVQVGLGLLRIPVKSSYEPVALRDEIVAALRTAKVED